MAVLQVFQAKLLGLRIAGASAGPAPHETPSALAETLSSAPCIASRTLSCPGEPGLRGSSGPLEGPPVVQAVCDHGHYLQKGGGFNGFVPHRLGSFVQGQTGLQLLVRHRRSATHQLPQDDGSM